MLEPSTHRPRNVGWARAGGLLYGDWGTSKAYVIGLAFVAAGFSSFRIILAVCALTGLVGYNYVIVCRHFPDGGVLAKTVSVELEPGNAASRRRLETQILHYDLDTW